MQFSNQITEAAQLWHHRIGRFLGSADWSKSLAITYPGFVGAGQQKKIRIGACKASAFMMDSKTCIFIDRLDSMSLPGLVDPEATFCFATHLTSVTNIAKTQINWALDPAREFPLLMVRPSKKSSMACLQLSHTPDSVVVCIPEGSFSFSVPLVRRARDYILKGELQKQWRKASSLREIIGLNDHANLSLYQQNKLITEHEKMLALFPMDVWLPAPGSGDHAALGESLAEKPEVEWASLPTAHELFMRQASMTTSTSSLIPPTPQVQTVGA